MYNNLKEIKTPINEDDEIKSHLIQIDKKIDQLFISINENKNLEPDFYSLSDLAREIGKSNQTIKYHLLKNFEPEVDFQKKNGKIYVHKCIVPQIKEHYER